MSLEVDLKAEVAKLRASQAKVEAEAVQKAKEYRKEMESLLKEANDFEKKLEEAESTNHSAQRKLATIAAEKEKLEKEHNEVKSVCEELMTMVEGQQLGR